jgi:hypothetical protein
VDTGTNDLVFCTYRVGVEKLLSTNARINIVQVRYLVPSPRSEDRLHLKIKNKEYKLVLSIDSTRALDNATILSEFLHGLCRSQDTQRMDVAQLQP